MNNRRIHSLFGCTHNPFIPDVPTHGLVKDDKIEYFIWRVEDLVLDGGFALVSGNPGLGKSVTLRLLQSKLKDIDQLIVGEVTRPQSSIPDFYRELGSIFGIDLKMSNKFQGFKGLRNRWANHINKTLLRPVVIIDEAQEANPAILSELRLLSSACLDSKILITVILSGDLRLLKKLSSPDFLPLDSRIRARLILKEKNKEEMAFLLKHALAKAGNPSLMTNELIEIIAEKSAGNPRAMMITCNELLLEATRKGLKKMDEELFITFYSINPRRKRKSND